jgi:hypothetical protein
MNRHTVTCYTYKANIAKHVSSHHFSLLPSHLFCYFQSFPAIHNARPNEPVGDDAEGNGVPLAETLAPNLIGSSSAGETHPSAADKAVPTALSGGNQKKKCVVLGTKRKHNKAADDQVIIELLAYSRPRLGTKRKHNKAADDQVIIELPPYRGPQSPLDIVAVEHLFERLFEAFRHISQAARTDAPAGDDAHVTSHS